MDLSYYKKLKLPPLYTETFRDPEVWETIRKIVLPEFEKNIIVRVWSAGCASGEEVRSLTSLLSEHFKDKRIHWSVTATDIQENFFPNHPRIRFQLHDLVTNPPPKHMNLILCRNVLMFFKPEFQEIICQNLHKSLRPGGFLVLGKAESLKGEVGDLFSVVDARNKIYKKVVEK